MKKKHYLQTNNEPREIDPVDFVYADDAADSGGYGSVVDERKRFRQIFLILRRYWKMILIITILTTGAVTFYVAQKPVIYRTESRVQVNSETVPNISTKPGNSVFVAGAGSDPVYFTTQFQILEGANLLRRVVKTLDLENNQDFLNPNQGQKPTAWQNVLRLFGLYTSPVRQKSTTEGTSLKIEPETAFNTEAEAERLAPLVGKISSGLRVSPVKDTRTANRETRLIEIEYTHRDPQIAAKIANTIAESYVQLNLEQKVEANAAAGDFLQKRVSELQSQIRRDEERLINYSRDNQILALDGSQNTVIQKLTDLNVKLGQAENERIAAEIAYRAALQNPYSGAIAESKDAKTGQIESNLLTLRQRLKQLKTEYTDEWVEVVEVRRQIENLEKELENSRKLAGTIQTAALEQTYREAASREKELRDNFETQRSRVLAQNEAAINYRMIQQEIETNKILFDNLLQKSKENDIVLNGTPNNVFVVDRALTPSAPVDPHASKDILLACLGSLGVGVGLAFFRNWLDDTIRYTDDLERKFHLPLLAAIPFGTRRLKTKLLGVISGAASAEALSLAEPEVAESFVKLRTFLLLTNEHLQTILISSADSGEGKTTTALNLAKMFAEAGGKVLLIDADLRMPRLHSLLNLRNETGLSNLLTDDTLERGKVIQTTAAANLFLLSAGPVPINPSNLVGNAAMSELMENLVEEFSYIIIDSPPVLLFTDGVALSPLADAVVLVVRDNRSLYGFVRETLQIFSNVGAEVAGIVLNGVTDRTPFRHIRRYYEKELPGYAEN